MSFCTVCTPTVLPSAMAIFSACSVFAALPVTCTLSPSTVIFTPDASRPCFTSSLCRSSTVAAFASLAPNSFSPALLTKLISPMTHAPDASGALVGEGPPTGADDPSVKQPTLTARTRLAPKKSSGGPGVFQNQADDRRDDRAGNAAADQLANQRPDIHAARRPLQHRDERGQERPAGRAA